MWFCYEQGITGHWNPVVYPSKPDKKLVDTPDRTDPVQVPEDCIHANGQPNIDKLVERFPRI